MTYSHRQFIQSCRHGGFGGVSPPQIEIWNINQWSFCQILECKSPLLKTFWWRFWIHLTASLFVWWRRCKIWSVVIWTTLLMTRRSSSSSSPETVITSRAELTSRPKRTTGEWSSSWGQFEFDCPRRNGSCLQNDKPQVKSEEIFTFNVSNFSLTSTQAAVIEHTGAGLCFSFHVVFAAGSLLLWLWVLLQTLASLRFLCLLRNKKNCWIISKKAAVERSPFQITPNFLRFSSVYSNVGELLRKFWDIRQRCRNC